MAAIRDLHRIAAGLFSRQHQNQHLFVDRVVEAGFAQSSVLSGGSFLYPTAFTFSAGKVYLFGLSGEVLSADATNVAGLSIAQGFISVSSPDGSFPYIPSGLFPSELLCLPSATAACLANRFKVEVTYDATPSNGSGPASVVLESAQSVKWTFFDPGNIEMILKILDACAPPFNHWWVFAGGLTNVGVSIKVTDTMGHATKTYTSKKGTLFQPFADTTAFDCP